MAVRVQREDFDIAHEVRVASAVSDDVGAVVTFTGTVRGGGGASPIVAMELEHYPGMTE
ncbi:MAG: molybdenum cofactor biosynthesis protein MoaE, partial [Hyphomicrobiaceae bacterium]